MSNLELADTRLTFDDLLEAVQDSKRGRWFLQEFESRLQKRDTSTVLAAISKIETRIEQLGAHASQPDDLSKVRSAISNARSDLFKLGLGKEAMSKEGRLFAEMAEMARKAIPEATDQSAGILRTLQLVDEIDRAVAPPMSQDNGSKFFAADANLFDRVPPSKPVLVEATPQPVVVAEVAPPVVEVAKPVAAPKAETVQTGAKLVIRKLAANASEAPAAEVSAPVVDETPAPASQPEAPAQVETPAQPTTQMQASDNPRIVIIRRRAEDMPEVALAGNTAA